ncbi:SEC-C metal-binding domain-containing protein [Morganella morganii]
MWRIQEDLLREESRKFALIKKIPGELRNQKCPCGSGRKAKNCQCDLFTKK